MLTVGLVAMPPWLIGLAAGVCLGFVLLIIHNVWYFSHFRKQGIKGRRPYPLVGTMLFSGGTIENYPYEEAKLPEKYGDVFAEFLGRRPALVVHDETFLAEVFVKKFSNFCDRPNPLQGDKINDAMLIHLEGDEWRRARRCLSGTMGGSNLKKMVTEINRCAEQLADSVHGWAEDGKHVDMRRIAGAFTMDVIASTAFGEKINSHKDTDAELVQMARRAFGVRNFNPLFVFALFAPYLVPLATKLGLNKFIPRDAKNYFADKVRKEVDSRGSSTKQGTASYLSFILNSAKDDKKTRHKETKRDDGLSETEVLANGLLFFVAGFETTAATLAFLLYNLAENPDCMEQVVKEIDNVVDDKDFINVDMLAEMPYLDQCVSESLRMFPPVVRTYRKVKNDVTIRGVELKKDMLVIIPTFGIHRDPRKWPSPDKFDPTRFTTQERANRNPYHFLPFGHGQRNCIGMRLALAEVKIAVIHVLRRFRLAIDDSTPKFPMKFVLAPLLTPANPMMVRVESRKKSD